MTASTPNGSHILTRDTKGLESADVTLAVQILYDALVASMDFGSGFLDAEETQAIADLAAACGFEMPCMGCHYPDWSHLDACPSWKARVARGEIPG